MKREGIKSQFFSDASRRPHPRALKRDQDPVHLLRHQCISALVTPSPHHLPSQTERSRRRRGQYTRAARRISHSLAAQIEGCPGSGAQTVAATLHCKASAQQRPRRAKGTRRVVGAPIMPDLQEKQNALAASLGVAETRRRESMLRRKVRRRKEQDSALRIGVGVRAGPERRGAFEMHKSRRETRRLRRVSPTRRGGSPTVKLVDQNSQSFERRPPPQVVHVALVAAT